MTVTVRTDVRALLDTMSEEELNATKRYIEFLQSGYTDMLQWLLDTAPEDDEPTTPEQDAAAAEAWAEFEQGEGISADEIKRTLLRWTPAADTSSARERDGNSVDSIL